MRDTGTALLTPILLKQEADMAWPQQEVFYLCSQDGLFLCRNHEFFRSCVPAPRWPGELAPQKPFLAIRYPRLKRALMERVVQFFHLIGREHGAEAAVLLGFNQKTKAIEAIVPRQVGTVSYTWHGEPFPMDLFYEVPPLPPHVRLIGDIHSHVDGPAYSSAVDKDDELHRPGLHIVIGRINDDPPEFHCEVTVDSFRFRVKDLSTVMEAYKGRAEQVPPEWLEQVSVKPWSSCSSKYRAGETLPAHKASDAEVIIERTNPSSQAITLPPNGSDANHDNPA